MNEEEVFALCRKLKSQSYNKIQEIKISYDDFIFFHNIFLNEFGRAGVLMILEKNATLTFIKYKNIRFLIVSTKTLIQGNFEKHLNGIRIIGATEKYDSKKIFKQDIKNNIKIILLLSIFYFIIYNGFLINQESLGKLNEYLIYIINVFIAAFFVFIAFFNGQKEKIIELYKNGTCDKFNANDKYIFKLSLAALTLAVLSNGIVFTHFGFERAIYLANKVNLSQYLNLNTFQILRYIKFNISFIFTWVSIIFLVICFDSILNYYLNKIRNNYFIEAFEEEIDSMK